MLIMMRGGRGGCAFVGTEAAPRRDLLQPRHDFNSHARAVRKHTIAQCRTTTRSVVCCGAKSDDHINAEITPILGINQQDHHRQHNIFSPRDVAIFASAMMMLSAPVVTFAAAESSSAPAWLPLAFLFAGPVLGLFELLMLIRIPLSWFPTAESKLPWRPIVIATEPLLAATRKVVPPQGGVDVSPIVWFAIASLLRELLVGGQGVLILLQNK
mmetsp:Transcript_13029/g.28338  ORF Transcript_13029/g.28338 Transcript_13029/m.28338 type:complete len:213 (+) Transcript_13029:21-659(+)